MAIVKMKKIVLAAPQADRDNILDLLQSKGSVELIDLREETSEVEGADSFKADSGISQTEADNSQIKFTYEFLKRYSQSKKGMFSKRETITKQEFNDLEAKIDWKSIYNESKELEDFINLNKNKISKAASLIEQYSGWIGFDASSRELEGLKRVSYFIGSISKKSELPFYDEMSGSFGDIYIEKVSEEKQDANLFILCHNDDKADV
jgi:V/A-type H+-transporting ATPase subunit I